MFNVNGYATIYNLSDKDSKGNQTNIFRSTLFNSNKNTDPQGKTWYEKQYWNAKFVGTAKEYIKEQLASGIDFEGARIKVNNGMITYKNYLDQKTSEKRKAYMITVFDFEIEKLSDTPQQSTNNSVPASDETDYPDYPDFNFDEGEMF